MLEVVLFRSIRLKKLKGSYAISQMSPGSSIPSWVDGEGFVSICRTADELSLVCLANRVPKSVMSDKGWACFMFLGPFEFDAAGVLLSVLKPISENEMGVFAVSTFDGDMMLLKEQDVNRATSLLISAGHIME